MILWFLAGAAVEVLNTLSRKWSVDWIFAAPGMGAMAWLIIVAGFVLRLGMTGGVIVLGFRQGVADGAAALIGYWLSRWAMIWWQHHSATARGNVDKG